MKQLSAVSLCLLCLANLVGCGGGGADLPTTREFYSSDSGYTTHSFKLPDTGQTQSYTDKFGEDSDYIINAPSYTDPGNGTLIDNNTGLVWHEPGTDGTWDEALEYCRTQTFGGYNDWRLPSKKELVYIADYDSMSSSLYWSSTANAYKTDYAWAISLPRGASFKKGKQDSYMIRCVREYQHTDERFIDNSDDTVSDINTGLMWQQQFIYEDDFEMALSYCEDMTLAGYGDWRLPNIKELVSIVDYTKFWPAIDTVYFPGTHHMTYWSSTTDSASPDDVWHVDFDTGSVTTRMKSSAGSKYGRCVRSIQ